MLHNHFQAVCDRTLCQKSEVKLCIRVGEGNRIAVDPDIVVKGAIADRLKAFFLQKNITSALINLGGNVLAVGQKPDGTAFRTGIKKPFSETNELVDIVALKDQSLVSSGNYERCFWENGVLYHHILDPHTGYPADTGLSSVTILSDSSTDGDALSTSCFLLGYEKGREIGVIVGSIRPSVFSDQYNAVCSREAVSESTVTGCPFAWLIFQISLPSLV